MANPIDLTGHTFSRLTVLSPAHSNSRNRRWLCKCHCGKTKVILGTSLRRGATQSCGCLHIEKHRTHNKSKTRLYQIWADMRGRCTNINNPSYVRYGAIGVHVCNEWKQSYEAFHNWAINNGYTADLTIDRINCSTLYSPETCRWATKTIQSRNRRPLLGKSSKYIGVYYRKTTNNYCSQIQVNKCHQYIGTFVNEIDAAIARDNYVKQNLLEGYTLNF